MNILIDSLNCNPNVGSNAEAGYGFTMQALKRNTVYLLSHSDLFHEGGNPCASIDDSRLHRCLIRSSLFKKFGRQTDYILQSYFHAQKIIRKNRIDLVHTAEPAQYCITRPLALLKKVPYVFGPINGGDAYPPPEFLRELGERSAGPAPASVPSRTGLRALADMFNNQLIYGSIARASTHTAFRNARIIAIGTENCLNNIPRRYHGKCVKIPCFGIDSGKFSPAPHPASARPVVLYAGRITAMKGLDLLIRAFPRVYKSEKALLRVVGAGSGHPDDERFEHYCRTLVGQLHIEDGVEFVGQVPRDALVGYYRSCDIFCLSSLWEPFGMVYLEAMACGKPVVAMAAGGPREIILPRFGITVEPRRIHQFLGELGDALIGLIQNTGKRLEMGAAARKHIEQHYTWDSVGEQMQRIYEMAA